MTTTKKKAARKAPAKTKTTKSNATRSAAAPVGKSAKPREGSFAQFMDHLVQQTADPKKLTKSLEDEAKKRGVKTPTLGSLRAHVRYRQRQGQLNDVVVPEGK